MRGSKRTIYTWGQDGIEPSVDELHPHARGLRDG
jgi:hypothetical protein